MLNDLNRNVEEICRLLTEQTEDLMRNNLALLGCWTPWLTKEVLGERLVNWNVFGLERLIAVWKRDQAYWFLAVCV